MVYKQTGSQLGYDSVTTTSYQDNSDVGTNFTKNFVIGLKWDLSGYGSFNNSFNSLMVVFSSANYYNNNTYTFCSAKWSTDYHNSLSGGGYFLKQQSNNTQDLEYNKFYAYGTVSASNKILNMNLILNFDGTYYNVLTYNQQEWFFQTYIYWYYDNT